MENDEDLAVQEIIEFLRYFLACAGHDAPFDIRAHIPMVEKLIENYDEAVSKENFNSISEGLVDAIALATQPIDSSFKPFTVKSSPKVTTEDLLNDDPIFPFTTRPSDVAEEITEIEDERVLATLLGASKDFLDGPTTYSTMRFQVWEDEGSYSVPVQFAEEVAAATVQTAAAVLSAAGGEE